MSALERLRRAAEFALSCLGEPAFWSISVSGRVVGSLVYDAGRWRLSWFDNADARLVDYHDVVSGDLDELAERLSRRVGAPVSLNSVIG